VVIAVRFYSHSLYGDCRISIFLLVVYVLLGVHDCATLRLWF
jgi:hypothetical protein